MRVLYNDTAPMEYTPEFFHEADPVSGSSSDSSQDSLFTDYLSTPYHLFKLKVSQKSDGSLETSLDEDRSAEKGFREMKTYLKTKKNSTIDELRHKFEEYPPEIFDAIIKRLVSEEVLEVDSSKVQLVKLLQKTLELCKTKEFVSSSFLQKELSLSSKVADAIMKKLKRDGCVEQKYLASKGFRVSPTYVQNQLKIVFDVLQGTRPLEDVLRASQPKIDVNSEGSEEKEAEPKTKERDEEEYRPESGAGNDKDPKRKTIVARPKDGISTKQKTCNKTEKRSKEVEMEEDLRLRKKKTKKERSDKSEGEIRRPSMILHESPRGLGVSEERSEESLRKMEGEQEAKSREKLERKDKKSLLLNKGMGTSGVGVQGSQTSKRLNTRPEECEKEVEMERSDHEESASSLNGGNTCDPQDYFFECEPKWTIASAMYHLKKVIYFGKTTIQNYCKRASSPIRTLWKNIINNFPKTDFIPSHLVQACFQYLAQLPDPYVTLTPPSVKANRRTRNQVDQNGFAWTNYEIEILPRGLEVIENLGEDWNKVDKGKVHSALIDLTDLECEFGTQQESSDASLASENPPTFENSEIFLGNVVLVNDQSQILLHTRDHDPIGPCGIAVRADPHCNTSSVISLHQMKKKRGRRETGEQAKRRKIMENEC
eukprot:TRINITY_DN2492_c0_g1_i3.p1 TRINITY_DN2492_c0_g1~~TRINITY_DN2492_c0_g1_i3.p1  ORF type:complete len:654 (-),score=156.83 TRINITY_DN2492_c0_g1_i3:691-2652(-)